MYLYSSSNHSCSQLVQHKLTKLYSAVWLLSFRADSIWLHMNGICTHKPKWFKSGLYTVNKIFSWLPVSLYTEVFKPPFLLREIPEKVPEWPAFSLATTVLFSLQDKNVPPIWVYLWPWKRGWGGLPWVQWQVGKLQAAFLWGCRLQTGYLSRWPH